jgi:hypothetical protein
MENYDGAMSVKPSMSAIHGVECARRENVLDGLYTRTGGVPSGQDQRFYDLGQFQLATVGFQAASVNIGELWVVYEMRLRKPKLNSGGGTVNSAHYVNTTSITSSAVYGTSHTQQSGSNMVLSLTGNVLAFPADIASGNYLVVVNNHGSGSSASFTFVTAVTGVNCTALLLWGNAAGTPDSLDFGNAAGGDGAGASAMIAIVVTITAPSATLSLSVNAVCPTATMTDVFVTQINPNVLTSPEHSLRHQRDGEMRELVARLTALGYVPNARRVITSVEEWVEPEVDSPPPRQKRV